MDKINYLEVISEIDINDAITKLQKIIEVEEQNEKLDNNNKPASKTDSKSNLLDPFAIRSYEITEDHVVKNIEAITSDLSTLLEKKITNEVLIEEKAMTQLKNKKIELKNYEKLKSSLLSSPFLRNYKRFLPQETEVENEDHKLETQYFEYLQNRLEKNEENLIEEKEKNEELEREKEKENKSPLKKPASLMNDKSKKLLEKSPNRYIPIYMRTDQILQEKSENIHEIKKNMEQEQLEKNRKEVPQPFEPEINLSYKDTRTHQVTCIEDRTIKQFINEQQQWNNKREETEKLKLFEKEQEFKEANTFQPKINGNSKKIFSTKVKTDESFSEPVEERLNKKREETNEKHKLKTEITNCYTFVPTINQNSKRLAQKFRDSKQNISAINLKKNSIYNLDQSQKSFYSNNMRQSSSFDIKNSIPDRKYSYNIIISRESQPLFSQSFFEESEEQNLSTSQMVSNASMNQPTQDSTTTYPNVDLSNLSFSQNQNLLEPQDSIAEDQESSSFMLLKDEDISLEENNEGSSSSENTQRINNKVKENVSKKPSKFVKENASASKHRDLSNTERSKAKTEKKSKELVNEVEYSPNIDFILNILNKSKMSAQLNYENLNSDNSHAIK